VSTLKEMIHTPHCMTDIKKHLINKSEILYNTFGIPSGDRSCIIQDLYLDDNQLIDIAIFWPGKNSYEWYCILIELQEIIDESVVADNKNFRDELNRLLVPIIHKAAWIKNNKDSFFYKVELKITKDCPVYFRKCQQLMPVVINPDYKIVIVNSVPLANEQNELRRELSIESSCEIVMYDRLCQEEAKLIDNSEKKQVFISYAREDKEIARELYSDLKKIGLNPWLDIENLLGGHNWRSAINQAINESSYFIALLSSNSISKRGYVQKELKIALDLLDEFPKDEIFIIPVRLDDCKPIDEKIEELNWVDLSPSYKEGFEKIKDSLKKNKITF